MASIYAELNTWAAQLPYWQQAALAALISGAALADVDCDALVQYLLEDHRLAESITDRPVLGFSSGSQKAYDGTSEPLILQKISNIKNVNALVPKQTLTFSPSLTAIYGANGSGKSGYARILGSAGFTRGDKVVLSDVTQSTGDGEVLSADIEVQDGAQRKVINHEIGSPCEELTSFYIFDSTSVRVHVTKLNEVSFSPAGLSVLTDLADLTDKVKERLKAKIEPCLQPHPFGLLFQGESEVSEIINELGPKTEIQGLRELAILTDEDVRRIEETDREIAKLKSQDIAKQLSELKQKISDLEGFVTQIKAIENGLNDEVCAAIRLAVNKYLACEETTQKLSVNQFKSDYFAQTGNKVWQDFIEAAKALADSETSGKASYPQADSRCLLCHQPLSKEARELLLRLWTYLDSEAQAKLAETQVVLDKYIAALNDIDLDIFDEQSVSYRHMQEHDERILLKVADYIEVSRQRRKYALAGMMKKMSIGALPSLNDAVASAVEQVSSSLKVHKGELETKDPSEEISTLEQELKELRHRELLRTNLAEIEDYVSKRIWADKASRISCTTNSITKKHKELFGKLVTDRYIELFEKTLADLKRPLKVKIKPQGKKGKLLKEICLIADSATPVDKAQLDKVLSEGEQRAVAIADFLTEVALDIGSCSIILDDPVTSLDVDWKETIAQRLVRETKKRQVIIFTHDLHFLYLLKKFGDEGDIEIVTHWVKRGDHDDKPGYVYLNNSPALEKSYRKTRRARDCYTRANGLPPEQQEAVLKEGFAALRANYEAFIMFDLFNEVVRRFEEPIRFGLLKGVVIDRAIVEKVIEKCEMLSRYIEAHLHSDIFSANKPTPKMLLAEIEEFEQLKKQHKELREIHKKAWKD